MIAWARGRSDKFELSAIWNGGYSPKTIAERWITSPSPGRKPHHVPLALVNVYLVGVSTFADCIYGIVIAGALNRSLLTDSSVRPEKGTGIDGHRRSLGILYGQDATTAARWL
jgi:hypothetical protein